jgi:hypothetical protein
MNVMHPRGRLGWNGILVELEKNPLGSLFRYYLDCRRIGLGMCLECENRKRFLMLCRCGLG